MNIVIIHTGFAKYLVYTLRKIKETNKNANVFLISDREYKEYSKYSTFVDVEKVKKEESINFQNKYIHLGKSNPNYEMFCMQRWIILKDFMKEYNLTECFHIDSDILLFSDLNEALKPFLKYDVSLAHNLALTMYIKDIKVLEEFSKYLLFKYTDEKEINKLKSMYYDDPNRVNNGVAGSISDMDLSREFFSNYQLPIGDLSEIENDSIFDSAIVYGAPQFEMLKKNKYEMKKIFFENDIPFCNYHNDNINKKIRFHSLHFIVWSKLYIKKLSLNKDLNFNPYYINIYREFNVFKSKFKKFFK
ncbi:hypothetical protein [Brachyspira hyodysenteriae]|uniref:Uncharacterized protein n=1 Tax=Brachyspira hyodysenteriae (strain ATCC 49526 / WA1) TaxID=565034 RepID=A0A3B6V8I9_BRAHW|nr:hypothetical protein [Brachyspira hyodysenteriae]ACN82865.1 hypothetical protein BHWA1_00366 [Brachyspira hyodysenteriae WA1]KLI17597.1 hypothetical protein SU45_05140 [Brachyspira hyodysenteriae]KLI20808.1 hypothetical protein SU43_11105 [Brachyspira hyodysenteriae]KLI29887.1 hypothetical protein SZ49_08600 [Brachyspira hyodysenteriae]KLI33432.1 hypothetical protein SZ50_07150 [Brachyspira hyodysenteriae]